MLSPSAVVPPVVIKTPKPTKNPGVLKNIVGNPNQPNVHQDSYTVIQDLNRDSQCSPFISLISAPVSSINQSIPESCFHNENKVLNSEEKSPLNVEGKCQVNVPERTGEEISESTVSSKEISPSKNKKNLNLNKEERLKRRREGNKKAASKCREKKKRQATMLLSETDELEARNKHLTAEVGKLEEERETLLRMIKMHQLPHKKCPISGQHCLEFPLDLSVSKGNSCATIDDESSQSLYDDVQHSSLKQKQSSVVLNHPKHITNSIDYNKKTIL